LVPPVEPPRIAQKHLAVLTAVLDLEALMAPAERIANRDVPQD
jgi:hypothetical protein